MMQTQRVINYESEKRTENTSQNRLNDIQSNWHMITTKTRPAREREVACALGLSQQRDDENRNCCLTSARHHDGESRLFFPFFGGRGKAAIGGNLILY